MPNKAEESKRESMKYAKTYLITETLHFFGRWLGPALFALLYIFFITIAVIWFYGRDGNFKQMLDDVIFIFKNTPHFVSSVKEYISIAVGFFVGTKFINKN